MFWKGYIYYHTVLHYSNLTGLHSFIFLFPSWGLIGYFLSCHLIVLPGYRQEIWNKSWMGSLPYFRTSEVQILSSFFWFCWSKRSWSVSFTNFSYLPFSLFNDSYLADNIYRKPVIIYNYPKETQPFFIRINDDRKTVAAFDLVIPKVWSNMSVNVVCVDELLWSCVWGNLITRLVLLSCFSLTKYISNNNDVLNSRNIFADWNNNFWQPKWGASWHAKLKVHRLFICSFYTVSWPHSYILVAGYFDCVIQFLTKLLMKPLNGSIIQKKIILVTNCACSCIIGSYLIIFDKSDDCVETIKVLPCLLFKWTDYYQDSLEKYSLRIVADP